ncbi:MAG TPA: hypothetical protein VES67_15115 [Vicinamibacterales bacterium]|nr:hypothetical protein [Vicinamibacterales bacterium]
MLAGPVRYSDARHGRNRTVRRHVAGGLGSASRVRHPAGASRSDIYLLVLRRGFQLVAIGVLVGLAAVAGLGRVLGSQLYETAPTDPVTLGLAAVLLLTAALAAHVVPLRRATGIQPNLTLRGE